jgi:hypothetical protein
MKKIFNFCALALFLIMITSCEKGFDELNRVKLLPLKLTLHSF